METIDKSIIDNINKIVETHLNKSDFDNREELSGMGFGVARFCMRYFAAGTEEYNYIYNLLFNQLSDIHRKAIDGVRRYEVELNYKTQKGNGSLSFKTEERTEEEAMQRAEQKQIWGKGKYPLSKKVISILVSEVKD